MLFFLLLLKVLTNAYQHVTWPSWQGVSMDKPMVPAFSQQFLPLPRRYNPPENYLSSRGLISEIWYFHLSPFHSHVFLR